MAHTRFISSLYVAAALDGETARHMAEVGVRELGEMAVAARAAVRVLWLIGHNKGWEEAASELSGQPVKLSTASAAVLEPRDDAPSVSWSEALGSAKWKLAGTV